jgi:hypothetical protein
VYNKCVILLSEWVTLNAGLYVLGGNVHTVKENVEALLVARKEI